MTVAYDKNPTYLATSSSFAIGTAPTDIFTITGNATTNVYVLKMGISGFRGAVGSGIMYITKRSTANSGGTSASVTAVPVQSGFAAAAATVLRYTVNPTAGSLIGFMTNSYAISLANTTSTSIADEVLIDFTSDIGSPVALLSESEVLAWNFNGVTIPGGLSVQAWVLWCEGPKT